MDWLRTQHAHISKYSLTKVICARRNNFWTSFRNFGEISTLLNCLFSAYSQTNMWVQWRRKKFNNYWGTIRCTTKTRNHRRLHWAPKARELTVYVPNQPNGHVSFSVIRVCYPPGGRGQTWPNVFPSNRVSADNSGRFSSHNNMTIVRCMV